MTASPSRVSLKKMESNLEKQEYILCAAIHFDDGIEHEGHHPVKSGFVICGFRHCNIYSGVYAATQTADGDYDKILDLNILNNTKTKIREGFLTSKNRFVDREEAYKIALHAGQVGERKNKRLFSEDLY